MTRSLPLGFIGRLGEADEALRQTVELSREHGELGLLSASLAFRVVIRGDWSGETATVLASARQSVEVAERVGVPFLVVLSLLSLGDAFRLEQRYEEALEAYEKALGAIEAKRVGLNWRPLIVIGQALVYSTFGEHEKAIAQARSALEECVSAGDLFSEVLAQWALPRVLLTAGDPGLHEEVEATLERAEALCAERSVRLLLPRLLEVRAGLAERHGDPQEARRQLREAHRLYTEIGATGHAKRLAGESEL
jgi:tetratricopeptide (TPR) repeat protein